ncbi:MAG TPA: radical SAM protein, partial [Methylophilaceae bacterium]|nr:radical SAM protein [Methylophilaceae bacterium]
QSLSGTFSAIEPPFLAALSADFIRNNGFEAGILDSNALGMDFEETAREVARRSPRLVNIIVHGQQPSASTQLMSAVGPLCAAIKHVNPETKILLTGTHPSALPERTMKDEACDFVGQGEGFHTVLGLLQKKDFSEVPGLWHRNNGSIVPPKMPAKDIEEKDMSAVLRGVAWDLLPMEKYRAHNWHCFSSDINNRQPYASLYTSFGCPYKCVFCCINAPFNKHTIRCFSTDWVMEQLRILTDKYKVKNLKIIDEMFVLRPSHVKGICDGITREGMGDKLNIWAYARIDTTNDNFLDLLQHAGFGWLGLGIESGSKHVRDGVEKGRFTDDDVIRIVRKIQAHKINAASNFIFGLPDDTLESMQQTLNLALRLNSEWSNFYCAMAYPGSQLYPLAKQKSLPLPDDAGGLGWIGYSQHAYETMPLPTETLPAADVLR